MPHRILVFSLCLVSTAIFANNLSPIERREIDERIAKFYGSASDDPTPMNAYVPKYSLSKKTWSHRNAFLKLDYTPANPLLALAQKKMTEEYQSEYCEKVLKKHFPRLYKESCLGEGDDQWATVENIDRVENLVKGWIPESELIYSLDELPTNGTSAMPLWSDDYWKTRWGLTSYRYSSKVNYPTYAAAIAGYAQPTDWQALKDVPVNDIPAKTVIWSPSEKYDLTVGDETFQLTREQKEEGKSSIGPDGNVEDWMGLCHGWTTASMMVPAPLKPAKVMGARGAMVDWYPADVRAMATLHWANARFVNNFIGGRCNGKTIQTYPNGRIRPQYCFDSNPTTFHLALGNMIGKKSFSFIMDKNFDYEVWNQPIYGYDTTYFNPLDPAKKSKVWKEVAVDYNDEFKAKDRFQKPLTRGIRSNQGYDDKAVKKIVGVITTVTYLVETEPPTHSPNPDPNPHERATYVYDLEIEEQNGKLIPTGGEWHQNAHPDFLWIPNRTSFANADYDKQAFDFTGETQPTPQTTAAAQNASANGAYPLCKVLKVLVKQSTGVDAYRCH